MTSSPKKPEELISCGKLNCNVTSQDDGTWIWTIQGRTKNRGEAEHVAAELITLIRKFLADRSSSISVTIPAPPPAFEATIEPAGNVIDQPMQTLRSGHL